MKVDFDKNGRRKKSSNQEKLKVLGRLGNGLPI
jgi:hypothetical protein